MNTKEAKDFLVGQAAQQAALDRIPFSDLERRMMYFTEGDPASCDDPIGLNGEFEEKYDTTQYEAKMSGLLRRTDKRLKAENSGGRLRWDDAVSTLKKGDHHLLLLLGQHLPMDARKDSPGNKVAKYGGLFVVGCFLLARLASDYHVSAWILESLGVLLFLLFFLTMFFLAQQGYRALRRRKSG